VDFKPPEESYQLAYTVSCYNVRYKNLTRKDIKAIIKLHILDKDFAICNSGHKVVIYYWEDIAYFLKGLK
jgi:hypothetical protein